MNDRSAQHQAVVQAAVRANIKLLVYTSLLKAPQTSVSVLKEHIHTEAAIRDSRIPYVILRNSWYIENYTDNVQLILSQGAIYGASGDGRIAAASRADLAEAAARVLLEDGHTGKTYELAGSHQFTKAELAGIISNWSHKNIAYQNMPPEQYTATLTGAGLPEPIAQFLVQADLAIAVNELNSDSDDLQFLIGHPAQTVEDVLGEMNA
ncbi:MAG: NmrA family NAD(P)-binding protein [Deltaproteobacteria bacterium]|nr:NmrA family NAD(P)-binding protein [Deltaproteobacteria bacterium]